VGFFSNARTIALSRLSFAPVRFALMFVVCSDVVLMLRLVIA
jgi:hypothetical protein